MVGLVRFFSMLLFQIPIDGTKEILSTKEVTIIGVLLFIIISLLYGLVYLYKRNEKQAEKRLEEQKYFTKELLDVTKATDETVKQVNEILKITSKKDE
jgi:preprotein translocase subunit SecG